jgi:hypothetical protein
LSSCPTGQDSIETEFLLEFPNEFDLGRVAKLGAHDAEDLRRDLARRLEVCEPLFSTMTYRSLAVALRTLVPEPFFREKDRRQTPLSARGLYLMSPPPFFSTAYPHSRDGRCVGQCELNRSKPRSIQDDRRDHDLTA